MADKTTRDLGINTWLAEELYQQYLRDGTSVDQSWRGVFGPSAAPTPNVEVGPGDQLRPLAGAAARIAENMTASLSIPLATSQRTIPVKVVEENRRLINQHRTLLGKSKVSYTHLIAWAIVRALRTHPGLNFAFAESGGQACRIIRNRVNLGVAVDVAGKDGNRSLVVPNIQDAGRLAFDRFLAAYDDLVSRARTGKLAPADFENTTISLTNPGTVGTVASVPRLLPGQGAIIATGVIDYPAEHRAFSPEMRARLGIGKVVTLTCTYDHRIIQGAESGMFLGRLQALLEGEDAFYEQVFADLSVPYKPLRWEPDRPVLLAGAPRERAQEVAKEAAILQFINAYRVRGHLIADLDPLGSKPGYHPELDPAHYGLTIWDLDREFLAGNLGEAAGEGAPQPAATLREILDRLRQTYCGKIGCEYMHIQHPEQKRWLQQRMEPHANNWPLAPAARRRILERLVQAEELEHLLQARFVGHKRFSLEGAETAIAILDELLERAAHHQVREAVIGMAHRGRLNVLANIVGKPLGEILTQFEGNPDPASVHGSGDVKYHLGASGVRRSAQGNEIAVSVAPNPSHLEAVDPVVEGMVRPKQDRLGDTNRQRVIPVLIHGDAAFAGQGVVAETLNLSQLEGYRTGGTVHLVINNQIGFTTAPEEARSTPYSTDVARMVQAPIFHVNGDDPEAAIRVTELAFDYRQQFKKDVVIDMLCYRRHGHSETDDPSYTQPLLYRKIGEHPSVATLYSERLARESVVSAEEAAALRKRVATQYAGAFQAASQGAGRPELQELRAVSTQAAGQLRPRTSVEHAALERILEGVTTFPAGFHLHPKLRGFIERRREVLSGRTLDWALAETLAFGSLLLEGTPVRLSGQDSVRGAFSQRHLELVDSEDGRRYVPLEHLASDQARFEAVDSSLSEYAVLGFEFGYSVADPEALVVWEAQFGDFANGAQILIDQFLCAAQSKWGQPSGLVLLLPHGYEGQGPEHSSARIERFLQLSAAGNLQLANCTTPAQYFHLLRRQMHGGGDRRGVRKPLVIFTPKSLLRHPKAVSALQELTAGGFREVLDDSDLPARDHVTKVLLCSGKIYYELLAAREEAKAQDVAIVRLEQLYPFPDAELRECLSSYPTASEVLWVQEEPRNMGSWRFVQEQLQPALDSTGRLLRYVGRPESASPATGSLKRHQQEQSAIVREALAAEAPARRQVHLVPKRSAGHL
jgi:2-oxoglutarate dehydrogenase E1 component